MPRSVAAFALKLMLHCGNSAHSPRCANASASIVRAKKPRSSWSRSGSTTQAPASSVSEKITASRSDDPEVRDGHDEAPAAAPVFRLLRQDLVGEVPRQQQHVVGLLLEQRLGRPD